MTGADQDLAPYSPVPTGPLHVGASTLGRFLDGQFQLARQKQRDERVSGDVAKGFYANDQWTAAEKRVLEPAGRPPAVVNKVFKAVNNIVGRQIDARLSYRVAPRKKEAIFAAAAMGHGLDFLDKANKMNQVERACFKAACVGPLGWAEVGYDDSDPDREPIFIDWVDDTEILRDPESRAQDLSDARFLVRHRMVDADVLIKRYPQFRGPIIAASSTDADKGRPEQVIYDYGTKDDGTLSAGLVSPPGGTMSGQAQERKRVCYREHHWWVSEVGEFLQMPDGERYDLDEQDPEAQNMRVEGLMAGGRVVQASKKCFYVASCVDHTVLEVRKSVLPFRRFPYIPLWGYRDPRDGRAFGLVEIMVWSQRSLNVNRSRKDEAARSRWIIYRQGSLGATTKSEVAEALARSNFALEVDDPSAIQIGTDKPDFQMWHAGEQQAATDVDEVAGLNEAAYGDRGNEKSGKAIDMRIKQQSFTVAELFDNWRFFRVQVAEAWIALMLRFWTPEKWRHVLSQQVISASIPGDMSPEKMESWLETVDLGWIDRSVAGINSFMRFNVSIEDKAETTNEREGQRDAAIELLGMLPDPAKMAIVPDILRMSDFPDAELMAVKAERALGLGEPAQMGPGGPPELSGMAPQGEVGPEQAQQEALGPEMYPEMGMEVA